MVYVNICHMRRTTIYLDPELEVLLKREMRRRNKPMAQLVREAVQAYVTTEPSRTPPGAGAFASGHGDTAGRVDELLGASGFGAPRTPTKRRQASPARRTAAGSKPTKR